MARRIEKNRWLLTYSVMFLIWLAAIMTVVKLSDMLELGSIDISNLIAAAKDHS